MACIIENIFLLDLHKPEITATRFLEKSDPSFADWSWYVFKFVFRF